MVRTMDNFTKQNSLFRVLASYIVVIFTYLSACPAYGQDLPSKPNAINYETELSRLYSDKATKVIGRYLRIEEFQVFAKVVGSETVQSIPYLPETLPPFSSSTDIATLSTLVKSVAIEVILADRYDNNTRKKIEDLLVKSLELDPARGDKVSFKALGLKLDRLDSEVARDLARSEAEVREFKTRFDVLGRERDDAKREVQEAQRTVGQIKSELERVTKEVASGNPSSGPQIPGLNTGNNGSAGFLAKYASLIVMALIGLIAILTAAFVLKNASNNLSSAIQTIGAGLPALGEKIGEASAQTSPALLPAGNSFNVDNATPKLGEPLQLGARGYTAGMTMESVARRVLELHEELSSAVNDDTEGLVLEYLSLLLNDESQVGQAVATMELLGKDRANQLYNRLASSQQQKVYLFLKHGSYNRPKGEVMLIAGEELKTKMFGVSFSGRANLSDEVRQKLITLSLDDQVAVALNLEGEKLARFFLYLDPVKVGVFFSRLREKDTKKFNKVAPLVIKVPDVEKSSNFDGDIVLAIDTQVARSTADIQGNYLEYYKTIVESVDDEVAEALAEHFAAANPRVEKFVRESIITFGTFFKLHGDIQEEIIESMPNKDLAALVASLNSEAKNTIYTHVEARRKELVEEEVSRLLERGTRNLTGLHKTAKRYVVTKIIQMKGSGSIKDMLAQVVEGLPAATSTNNNKAA